MAENPTKATGSRYDPPKEVAALFERYGERLFPEEVEEEVVTTSRARAKPEAPSTSGIPNRPDQVNQFSFYDDPDPVEPPTPVESPPTIDAPGVDPIWDQDQSPEAATERMRQDAIRFDEQVGSWLPPIARDYDFHTQPFVEYDVWRNTWLTKNAPGISLSVNERGEPDPEGEYFLVKQGEWDPEAATLEGKKYQRQPNPEKYLKDRYMHEKLVHANWKQRLDPEGRHTIDHPPHRPREHGIYPSSSYGYVPRTPETSIVESFRETEAGQAVERKIEGASDAAKDSLMALFTRLFLPAGVTVKPRVRRKKP